MDYYNNPVITLKQKDLKELIEKTSFAASINEEIRPSLRGCNIKVSDNKISFVSLDGYRMAICTKEIDGEFPTLNKTVYAKDLNKVLKLLENDEDNVIISFANSKMYIEVGATKVISSQIGPTKPNIINDTIG